MPLIYALIFTLSLSGCASWLSEDKETAELHLRIGTAHLDNGNYPQALGELMQAEKLDPSSPQIQNNLGLAYFAREKLDLAEEHLRKAISLNGNYSDAKNNLGRVLIERRKYNDAISVLTPVINDLTYNQPEKPLLNVGTAYFKMNDFRTARSFFLKSLEYQRDSCIANSYYGRSLFELKDFKNAAEALDRGIGYCQKLQYDEPHYYSALAYYQIGDPARAQVRLEELIKLYPNGKYRDRAKTMLETMKR